MENQQINTRDLKIVSKTTLDEVQEEFGRLMCSVEYLEANPKTNKVDISKIMKSCLNFRDILRKL